MGCFIIEHEMMLHECFKMGGTKT